MDGLRNASLDLLRDEYKILQDKIDKIGAFRFTIRGWSVTAVVGGFLAGSGIKSLPMPLISISVTITLLSFVRFEKQQVVLSNQYMARAREVEELIRTNQRTAFVGPLITQAGRQKRLHSIPWYDFYLSPSVRKSLLKFSKFRGIWKESKVGFYVALIVLSWCPQVWPKIQDAMRETKPKIYRIENYLIRKSKSALITKLELTLRPKCSDLMTAGDHT